MNESTESSPRELAPFTAPSRRTLAKGAAWSVPVLAMGAAAPALAVSSPIVDVCNGCLVFDVTHQNLLDPPSNTWASGPINDATTPASYGTYVYGYYAVKYTCAIDPSIRYVQTLVTYNGNLQTSAGTTISSSDGGTVVPVYAPGAPSTGGAAIAGVTYGPNSGAAATSNVSALGYFAIYAGNVGWSNPATDLTTGPTVTHHLTGVTFPATVQFTNVYMDGTTSTNSCGVNVALVFTYPYPNETAPISSNAYWYHGALTAVLT